MAEEEKTLSNWVKPEGAVEEETVAAREEFISSKTEAEWAAEAQAAGKDVSEYLTESFNSQQAPADREGGAGSGEFTPNPLWEDLKVVDGFEMPEGLTSENEAEFLKKALVDNKMAEAEPGQGQQAPVVDPIIESDPDIKAYLNYKKVNPDATLEDFVSQKTQYSSMLSLDDRDFMVAHLKSEYGIYDAEKNPDGLTEDQIEDTVSGMEDNKTLLLESRKIKKEYRAKGDSVQVTDEDVTAAEQARRQQSVDTIKADAQKLFAETNKITELNGVKLSKAEVGEINEAFEKAVIPDDKGNVPIMSMLQSDRVLWNFFAVNYLGDEKFKSALFSAGDATKEDIYKRLGLKPITTGGRQADTGGKNVITPGLWSTPDPNDV